MRPRASHRLGANTGFTLVELMVTVAIIGLILQVVYVNIGSIVPEAKLDAEAKKLVSNLDFIRSEARLQGKRYEIELDLDEHRWRYVRPPEQRLTTDQGLEDFEPVPMSWTGLEDGVEYRGAGNDESGVQRQGRYKIVFDESGFSADQAVIFGLLGDENLVWTVQLHGLTGRAEIIQDVDGQEHLPELPMEIGF